MITQTEVRAAILRKVTEARESAGFNKAEMARRMGMAASTWFEYEQGKYAFDLYQLLRVADVTDRDISFFVPSAAKPDLIAALESAYPGITREDVNHILTYAAFLVASRTKP